MKFIIVRTVFARDYFYLRKLSRASEFFCLQSQNDGNEFVSNEMKKIFFEFVSKKRQKCCLSGSPDLTSGKSSWS